MLSVPTYYVFITTDFTHLPPMSRSFDTLEHAVACARSSVMMGCTANVVWWVGGGKWTGGNLLF